MVYGGRACVEVHLNENNQIKHVYMVA